MAKIKYVITSVHGDDAYHPSHYTSKRIPNYKSPKGRIIYIDEEVEKTGFKEAGYFSGPFRFATEHGGTLGGYAYKFRVRRLSK